ncbi:hypothetical protein D9611_002306 [Ephemerocybe angulata]|uniref:Magnesium transporter NIPA-domain-containing protein n=2 Tax=Ephemerocybe angulata TaxID=980116 RepID=A0A8H6IE88_9AGAR|nr:hypothetical protein D9611_002306 [Tulosesus angulatus]KAF6762854.1 magnesium transporter NIPA-domain-containing protein [Tulosesus angulatus]
MAQLVQPVWSALLQAPITLKDTLPQLSEQLQGLPAISTQTFVGIVVAISGNVLISFALNLQKLAHKRTEQKRRLQAQETLKQDGHLDHVVPEEPHEEEQQAFEHEREQVHDRADAVNEAQAETLSLIVHPVVQVRDYGAASPGSDRDASRGPEGPGLKRRSIISRLIPFKSRKKQAFPIEIVTEQAVLHGLSHNTKQDKSVDDASVDHNEGDYLKSKIWWLGFLLMNIGEIGNFISYAFAPASVVAPLGTFALIANCFFAPLMLKEKFRKRDLIGVLIAIIGAITVVLASNASDTRLDADGLLRAVLQIPFMVFSIVYVVGAIVLAGLSESSLGRRWPVIDVGLCALFGGFTVLSTKALSTLLTIHWLEMFAKWITYPLLLVLASTGVGQIRYLNRALMRFDSKMVIPIQFVLFTLSAIIGSAILYGDFKKARFHQIVTFLYGCAATFAGVFVIAWAPNHTDHGIVESEAGEDPTSLPGSPEQTRLGPGTIGRRRRATLVLPSGVNGVRDSPSMRRKHSAISMGLSPAQHLLLVHTPPVSADGPLLLSGDEDLGDTDTELGIPSPDSYRRRRAMSWYGNEAGASSRTRDSSLAGRRQQQNRYGRVGSLETHHSSNR